jgi:glycosyltransferase involved in cell wall biosynthesis
MRYLLITHIPFARRADASILLDRLWAEDLLGLAHAVGSLTVAAPESTEQAMQAWGAGFGSLTAENGIQFVGLPIRKGRVDPLHRAKLRKVLRAAVAEADLVHTSYLFEPNIELYFAHDLAVRTGKKTLFVVAEDFYDMSFWEWVRPEMSVYKYHRNKETVERLDEHVRQRVRTASLTFLHTPAAVARYRLYAANAFAIRQPVHEREDVLSPEALAARAAELASGVPLRLVTASRMQPLKGLDMLIRAVAILNDRGMRVHATLYGSGPQLESLRKLAEIRRVAHLVEFPGPVQPASELRAALAAQHVFLMPHLTSDFGRAFFDAIAAALPLVAFRSIASQDTVRDGIDGLLAANADPESLAAAIAHLDRDRALLNRMAEAARLRALDNTKSFWNAYRLQMIQELFTV